MQTEAYWAWVRENSMRSGQPGLNGIQLSRLQLPIPSSQTEQTAIATILSDMDAELEALEARLAKAQQLKTGMMHNLLTGKNRLV